MLRAEPGFVVLWHRGFVIDCVFVVVVVVVRRSVVVVVVGGRRPRGGMAVCPSSSC
jgi:hypothetical protein